MISNKNVTSLVKSDWIWTDIDIKKKRTTIIIIKIIIIITIIIKYNSTFSKIFEIRTF